MHQRRGGLGSSFYQAQRPAGNNARGPSPAHPSSGPPAPLLIERRCFAFDQCINIAANWRLRRARGPLEAVLRGRSLAPGAFCFAPFFHLSFHSTCASAPRVSPRARLPRILFTLSRSPNWLNKFSLFFLRRAPRELFIEIRRRYFPFPAL